MYVKKSRYCIYMCLTLVVLIKEDTFRQKNYINVSSN